MIFHAVHLFRFCFIRLLSYGTADFQPTLITSAIRRAGTEMDLNCNIFFKFKHCKPG